MFNKISALYARIIPFFHLVVSVLYGLLVIFCLVGALLGKGYVPVVGIVLVCISWASARILREAAFSAQVLSYVLKGDKLPPSNDDHS